MTAQTISRKQRSGSSGTHENKNEFEIALAGATMV